MHRIAELAESGEGSIVELVKEFYSERGPIAEFGWELRPQQREMSIGIAQAYARSTVYKREKRQPVAWCVYEAPCGSGKGLAYLVPGFLIALRERKLWKDADKESRPDEPPKLVVSTANITLQEQLINKDIPALADMLDVDIRSALLKGRNNYVCRRELAGADGKTQADDRFAQVMEGLEAGWDGDKESLSWDPAEFWTRISRTSQECTGPACAHYKMSADNQCFWRKAVHGWQQAHVVVVNHHLLTLQGGMNACLLAVDEMHELENSVRSAVSGRLTKGAGKSLAARAAKLIGSEAKELIEWPVAAIMDALRDAFERLNPRESRWPKPLVLTPGWAGDSLLGHVRKVQTAYEEVRDVASDMGCHEVKPGHMSPPSGNEEAGKAGKLSDTLYRLVARCEAFSTGAPPTAWPGSGEPWALYVEGNWSRDGHLWLTAQYSPADVSWAVRTLQGKYPVAVLTSATVPAFESLRLTYGMPRDGAEGAKDESVPWVTEKRLPSPYDLPSMGVVVVPRGPSPKDAAWRDWAGDQVVDLVAASSGRALVLASSVAQMRKYGVWLKQSSSIPYPVKVQGEEGRAALREWFKTTTEGVLCATRSFFQGLDVQGDSCVLVIIDRIPFARPNDPVEDAVQRLLVQRAGGGSGYMLRSVPDAAQVLAQGSGRLIRSGTDRGAVAILDNRILKGGAGWRQLKAALPPFPVSYDVQDVRRLLDGEPLDGLPAPPRVRKKMLRWS